jgi:hypothetical protein
MATVASNHLNFIYKLDGDVTEVDVFKLAPALLALGELIQDSNVEINPEGKKISVNVKPFREGSFVVDLRLFAESNFQQIIDFLKPHSLEQLKTLLEVIGLIGGLPYGAVKAIKHLKGRPKTVEEPKPGEFRYTSIEDKSITVNGDVHRLLTNPKITNNIYKIYVSPLEELPQVDEIKTYIEGQESEQVVVGRNEVPTLKEFVNPSPTPTDAQEITKETLHKGVYLNPQRGSFLSPTSALRTGSVPIRLLRPRTRRVASPDVRITRLLTPFAATLTGKQGQGE